MAINFLLVSRSYKNALHRSKGSYAEMYLKRRAVVVKYLNGEYNFKKDANNIHGDIRAELLKIGIEATDSNINSDKAVYRYAYLYYHGGKDKVLAMIKKSDHKAMGAKGLIEDGFVSWENIVNAFDALEKGKVASTEANGDFPEVESYDKLTERFLGISEAFCCLRDDMLGQFRALRTRLSDAIQKIAEQKGDLRVKEEIIISLQGKLDTANKLLEVSDLEMAELKEELAKNNQQLAKLKQVSNMPREEKGINATVASLAHGIQHNTSNSVDIGLPNSCKPRGAKISYGSLFMSTFMSLSAVDKELITKSLEVLSKCGPDHQSLRTREYFGKGQGTISGDMKSVVDRKLSFFWRSKSVDEILIFKIYQR